MKPHSLRRALWLTNVALGVAVVGVLAWYVVQVRPAVAKDTVRAPNFQPESYKAMRKDYENLRVTGLKWTPDAPVSDDELHKVVLRSDYEKRKPPHWIFSGPMPPPIVADEGPKETGPPPPTGLEALGSVMMVLINPPANATVTFKFGGGKTRAFSVGEFVRVSEGDAARFKLTDVVEDVSGSGVYRVKYDVFGSDPDKPEGEGSLVFDQSGRQEYGFLRGEGEPKRAATGGDGPGATGAAGSPAGTAGGADPSPAANGAQEGEGAEPARVIAIKPAEELTLKDLKPTILYDDNDRNRRAVVFDDNSRRYFQGKNATSLAETVKTAVAEDPKTGRKIGLRITGWEEDAPADVFDIRRGDILVSINGQKVLSRSDAVNIIQKLSPERLVTVVIDRNTRLITYHVDPRDPKVRRNARYFDNLR